jgi:exodeoxyribonuclease VII large subunit
VPDLAELVAALDRGREALRRGASSVLDRRRERLERDVDRLRRGARLLLERRRTTLEQCAGRLRALSPRATLSRGYAIVRHGDGVVRSATALAVDDRVEVELAAGGFTGRVEEVRP